MARSCLALSCTVGIVLAFAMGCRERPQPPAHAAWVRTHSVRVERLSDEALKTCTAHFCSLALPAGTHTLTVKYWETLGFGSNTKVVWLKDPQQIDLTLHESHEYTLTAMLCHGRVLTPGLRDGSWFIRVRDDQRNVIVFSNEDERCAEQTAVSAPLR